MAMDGAWPANALSRGRPSSCFRARGLLHSRLIMDEVLLVREWDADSFHRRVLELESQGYTARRDSYRITPEMDPQTGKIVHLYTIEMSRVPSGLKPGKREIESSGH